MIKSFTTSGILIPLILVHGLAAFENAGPELRLARVDHAIFLVRLFSKFEDREVVVVDAEEKVTRIRASGLGEPFQFPEGTYRVIPGSHPSYGRTYRGALSVGRRAKEGDGKAPYLQIVLRLLEEDYLASVVACERIPGSGLEA
ncbi:MAG: hypothetical protein JNM63_12470, partial [Spirochaetia bacterium]|nr:hypothetical protein [Spirochaetia bacterium]